MRDEAELHAYVDGRLDPAARAAVEARLAVDAEAARTVEAWLRQKEALQALHAGLLQEPLPPPLAQAGRHLHQHTHRAARWARWGGMAASVLLAFAAGWSGHQQWQSRQAQPLARGAGEFARQAVLAHSVYLPEVRHPVEVEAAQQDHLVQWLSRRLNKPLKVPNLAAVGYELVGGRLLPGEMGARAQFMFQNAAGERITLYLGAIEDANLKATGGETAFRFSSDGAIATFYWVDQGFGYALAGKQPRQRLLTLAELVHRQL